MSNGLTFYLIDTETTGLLVGTQEIVEISIIRCADRVQLTRVIKAMNPRAASHDALMITGKTMKDLAQGISKIQAINDVDNFFQQDGLTPAHRCLIAHNSNFDRRFMHHMWKEQKRDFQVDLWLDTIPMCKRLATQMGQPKAKVKLDLAMDLFGLKKVGGLHTAKGDSRNTYYLWQHLMASGIPYIDLIKQFPQRIMPELSQEDMNEFEDF